MDAFKEALEKKIPDAFLTAYGVEVDGKALKEHATHTITVSILKLAKEEGILRV